MDNKFASTDEEINEVKNELKEIKTQIGSIDQRLSRLEGRFEERGYWESREFRPKLKGEDK